MRFVPWPAEWRLVDVEAADVKWIGKGLGHWACSERWSSIWEKTPTPAVLSEKVWHDVAWQQAIRRGGAAAGLLQLVSVSIEDGVGRLDLFVDPRHIAAVGGQMREFLRRVFELFPLRKVIVALPEDQFEVPAELEPLLRPIGSYSEHMRRGFDRYVDLNLYEIWSEDATDP